MFVQTASPADDDGPTPDKPKPVTTAFGGAGAHGCPLIQMTVGGIGPGSFGGGSYIGIGGGAGDFPYHVPTVPLEFPNYVPIGPGTVPCPGIQFPPAPQEMQPIFIRDYAPGLTSEQIKEIFDLILTEQAKKKAEADMVNKAKSRYDNEDPIREPSSEGSDSVYKIPYASGGPVGRPGVSTAIGGLFLALWVFTKWAVTAPFKFGWKVTKAVVNAPIKGARKIAYVTAITWPAWMFFVLTFLAFTGPRWIEPLMTFGGWPYDLNGNWQGFSVAFLGLYTVWLVLGILHYAHRKLEGRWFWEDEK